MGWRAVALPVQVVRCGGPETADQQGRVERQLAQLRAQGGPHGVVPLAKVTQGAARHRALLFKWLCDDLFPSAQARCAAVSHTVTHHSRGAVNHTHPHRGVKGGRSRPASDGPVRHA